MYLNAIKKNDDGQITDSKEMQVDDNFRAKARKWSWVLGASWTVNIYNGTRLYSLPEDTYRNGFDLS